MIIDTDSDLFESPAKILVNTVNSVGVMGKGIALHFKKAYPDMFRRYQEHCKHQRLTIGKLYLHKTAHKWILNFPTKDHWRYPSRVEYIDAGLKKFRASCAAISAPSIAFPMLGCGNGELDFDSQVRPLMEEYLGGLPMTVLIHVGLNHIGQPDHFDAARVIERLRSNPAALPFDEVWRDLANVLEHQDEFRTLRKQTAFKVHMEDSPAALAISSSDRTSAWIGDEELFDFWQQFREHGLIHASIAPNNRHLSYLMPVFERLDYVRLTAISKSASRLRPNPSPALQLVPPPTHSERPVRSLFGRTGTAAPA